LGGQPRGETRAAEVAATRLIILAAYLPGRCRHGDLCARRVLGKCPAQYTMRAVGRATRSCGKSSIRIVEEIHHSGSERVLCADDAESIVQDQLLEAR